MTNKQIPTVTNQHATTEELLEMLFSVARTMSTATQQHGKHTSATIEELCFLHSP
jgi:hypothetical protein